MHDRLNVPNQHVYLRFYFILFYFILLYCEVKEESPAS
jgi:hypothetical protein